MNDMTVHFAKREIPHNFQAEYAVLGAIMTNSGKALEQIEEILKPEHFYDSLNARVYQESIRLYNQGRQANPVTLKGPLTHADCFEGINQGEYFARLLMAFVGLVNVRDYASVIRDAWLRRSLMEFCTDTIDRCAKPEDRTAEDLLENVEEGLLHLSQGMSESQPNVSLHEAGCTALTKAREAVERGSALAGMSWGYKSLDRMTNGLVGGNMYVVGARPAMGKTSWALGIALRVAQTGKRTLFWSGEMTAEQVGGRAAAAKCGLNLRSVFSGRRWDVPEEAETGEQPPLEAWQWQAYQGACDDMFHIPLEIDTRAGLTIPQLRARARRMKRSKKGLDLIVLDYFQLMRSAAKGKDLYEEGTKISNELKILAKELDVPLVVLAQLNRESEKREDKKPTEADLRGTGALEQDADVVCLIHREHYYLKKQASGGGLVKRDRETSEQYSLRCQELADKLEASKGKGSIILAKNRHGPTGTCRMWFDDQTTWFRDAGEDPRSPAWAFQRSAA